VGKVLTDKQGNVIAKLLQFVATDQQVNDAMTKYLDENGISLADGIDLKKLNQNVEKNESEITGIKESMEDLKKVESNVLLEYKDHFFTDFEPGYINNETGEDSSTAGYVRSEWKKINMTDAVFIINIPSIYQCALYFYNSSKEFQGATEWLHKDGTYRLSNTQEGWYLRILVYSAVEIEPEKINVILAGAAVTKMLDEVAAKYSGTGESLGEDVLTTSERLELNVTRAALQKIYHPNHVMIPFLTDLHISCTSGKSMDELAKNASKIRRHVACYNLISKEYPVDICVYGGDYLNNSSQTDKETALEGHRAVRKLMDMGPADIPTLVCKGNHDDNTMYTDYKNGYVDSELLYTIVTSKDAKNAHRNVDDLERSYGFYDIPNKKIRVFALNSDDVPTKLDEETNKLSYGGQNTAGFSQDQLQFVADNLKFSEEGWQVIFFSHHPLINFKNDDTEAEGYTCSGVTANHGGQAMLDIIRAFSAKAKGKTTNTLQDFEIDVSYDFSANKSNTVIASICGHTHVYCHKEEEGIHYIATRAVLGHPTYQYISTSSYIVIDRKNRSLTLIANGDGEDYTYNY